MNTFNTLDNKLKEHYKQYVINYSAQYIVEIYYHNKSSTDSFTQLFNSSLDNYKLSKKEIKQVKLSVKKVLLEKYHLKVISKDAETIKIKERL